MKNIEIGTTYYHENVGTYYEVLKEGLGHNTFVCRSYEIDENDQESNVTECILTASELSRMIKM